MLSVAGSPGSIRREVESMWVVATIPPPQESCGSPRPAPRSDSLLASATHPNHHRSVDSARNGRARLTTKCNDLCLALTNSAKSQVVVVSAITEMARVYGDILNGFPVWPLAIRLPSVIAKQS